MKKSLIVIAAAIGLFLINLIPVQNVNSQENTRKLHWIPWTFQCPDGVGTFKKCVYTGADNDYCIPGTIYDYPCNSPSN